MDIYKSLVVNDLHTSQQEMMMKAKRKTNGTTLVPLDRLSVKDWTICVRSGEHDPDLISFKVVIENRGYKHQKLEKVQHLCDQFSLAFEGCSINVLESYKPAGRWLDPDNIDKDGIFDQ